MTIRHLLTMTSGIQSTGTGMEVYAAPDMIRLAIAAELTTALGAALDTSRTTRTPPAMSKIVDIGSMPGHLC
jgi:CubicO group peptidase (beta-lactamase class C family)